jgi:hypothetical protein
MEALAEIVKSSGAKIVLSSSWKDSPAKMSLLSDALIKWGIGQVWSCTPGATSRVEEIDEWLRQFVRQGHESLDGLLAIDDQDLTVEMDRNGMPQPSRIKPYSLRTESKTGLAQPHVLRAMTILQRKVDLRPWTATGDGSFRFSNSVAVKRDSGKHSLSRYQVSAQRNLSAPVCLRIARSCSTRTQRRDRDLEPQSPSLMTLQLETKRASYHA